MKDAENIPALMQDLGRKARQAMHRVRVHLKPASRTEDIEHA